MVNEAAFARGHRTADDNLDLARTCPGDPNGSITERIAHALSQLIRSADLYIDLHTGGAVMSVFPLSGYVLHRDPQVLGIQRRMAKAFNLPIVWGTSANWKGARCRSRATRTFRRFMPSTTDPGPATHGVSRPT